jgi:hypothetical protein
MIKADIYVDKDDWEFFTTIKTPVIPRAGEWLYFYTKKNKMFSGTVKNILYQYNKDGVLYQLLIILTGDLDELS